MPKRISAVDRKTQSFTYELRIWPGTDEGNSDEAMLIPFPVEASRIRADLYAEKFAVALWAFLVVDISPVSAPTAAAAAEVLIGDESIEDLKALRSDLTYPIYGLLVRRATKLTQGVRMLEFGCDPNDDRFQEVDALSCAQTAAAQLEKIA